MTTVELNLLKEEQLKMVQKNFKKDGSLVPVALVSYANGGGEVIHTQFQEDKDKRAFAIFLKKHCREQNPIALMLISEAYMISVPKSRVNEYLDDVGNLKVNRPQDNEDSIPVIVCSFETKLTSEVIIYKTKSVGGIHLILSEERKGKMTDGIFKDILTTPIGYN